MINHNSFYRSLAKKGGTITLSSNDQPSIGAFSIGKEGNALGARIRRKRASRAGARGWGVLPCNIGLGHRKTLEY